MKPPTLPTFIILGAAAATLCVSTTRAATFANGDFDTVAAADANGAAIGASSTAVPGWTTTVGNGTNANVYVNNANNASETFIPNPQDGAYCVQLDGSSNTNDNAFAGDGSVLTPKTDSISQTFTEPVGTYVFSFYLNNEVGSGKGGTSGALVSLSGAATGSFTSMEYTVTNPSAATRATSMWKQYTTAQFTVTNAATPLTLTFVDDPNKALSNYVLSSNIAIDHVTLAAVPEPSTLVGVAAGLVGLLTLQRARRGSNRRL